MLIEFGLKNYTSFKEKALFSAETGERLRKYKYTNTFEDDDISLLKNILIFGANGAGKSQLINGLGRMQNMVINGAQTVTDKLNYTPFLFNPETLREPTTFYIKLKRKNNIYQYSFSYNATEIIKETLCIVADGKVKTYFDREKNGFNVVPTSLANSKSKLRKNELFLYLAQQENDKYASEVYKWFVEDLMFVDTANRIPNDFLKLMQQPDLKNEMVSFLNFADLNITDLKVRKISINIPEKAQKIFQMIEQKTPQSILQLYTVHSIYDDKGKIKGKDELPLELESLGTQRLFFIVLAMIFSQINGNSKTLIIDEFDDSLHHELASALVNIFNSKQNNNQYILTTHDYNLLDNNIRIDQIYFIEKDFMGVSNLESAFDFTDSRTNARHDINLAKKYIRGEYGAVPVIDVAGLTKVLENVNKRIGGANI